MTLVASECVCGKPDLGLDAASRPTFAGESVPALDCGLPPAIAILETAGVVLRNQEIYVIAYPYAIPVASSYAVSYSRTGALRTRGWIDGIRTERGRVLAEIRARAVRNGMRLIPNAEILDEIGSGRRGRA